MARPSVYNWPASDPTLIAAAQIINPAETIAMLQNPAGAGNLTLNGSLVTAGVATIYPVTNVSIFSDQDLHLLNFVITGTAINGAVLSETVTGPNNTTVFSVNQYATVTSVHVSGAGNNIAVGIAAYMALNSTPFVFQGISRAVSITSDGDLTTTPFTVTGTLNGAVVSETLNGANTGVVYTTQIFDTVTSVTAGTNFGPDTASVGSGLLGYTHWYLYNYHATVLGFTAEVDRAATTINYSFQTTLDDVQINTAPTLFTPIAAMTAAATSQFSPYNNVMRYSRIAVLAGTNTTGAFTATFLQQGIT